MPNDFEVETVENCQQLSNCARWRKEDDTREHSDEPANFASSACWLIHEDRKRIGIWKQTLAGNYFLFNSFPIVQSESRITKLGSRVSINVSVEGLNTPTRPKFRLQTGYSNRTSLISIETISISRIAWRSLPRV